MTAYDPPVADMMFVLDGVARLDSLAPGAAPDRGMTEAILSEAARLARDVLAPLNAAGDREGCVLSSDGLVATPPGFREAYALYRDAGWNGIPFSPDHGGQGLPWALAFAVQEMWQGANMAFGLCPMLNQAAVEAIAAHGSAAQKEAYLPRLVSGEWTGTMNLTEAQAGTDLAAIRTVAERREDGSYALAGQKIFITYGEHDFTPNIVHMVLARVRGAPEGVKGISLFLAPRTLADGTRNDIRCIGLEHKLGIHASPTCTMQYGEKGGATAYLVGRENEGLKYMFTMMNNARLSVGLQGVALAERATQQATAYAAARMQGARDGAPAAIAAHPDVKRMLMSMRALVAAGRALAYSAALDMDKAASGDAAARTRAALLTPVVKAWCTDMAVEVASTGIQVHGGLGYIEETGAAQFYRDARILPIYEGANGVQAMDLRQRKILADGGAGAEALFADMAADIAALDAGAPWAAALSEGLDHLRRATRRMLECVGDEGAFVATPYLESFGVVAGGWMMARRVLAARGGAPDFAAGQRDLAHFYCAHILPRAGAAARIVLSA